MALDGDQAENGEKLMPILEVEIVTSNGDILAPGLAQSIADSAGAVLGTPPGRTWVKLRALSR